MGRAAGGGNSRPAAALPRPARGSARHVPEVQFVSGVVVAIGLLLAAARMTGLPPSPLLFAAGLASALLGWPLPEIRASPEVMLGLLLPPLLCRGDALRRAVLPDRARPAGGRSE